MTAKGSGYNSTSGTEAAVDSLMWPTPVVSDMKGAHTMENLKNKNRNPETNGLADCVAYREKLWATPQASDNVERGNLGLPCIQRRIKIGKQVNLSMSVSDKSGKLNPDWVEHLMGYPDGWTDMDRDDIPHEITEFLDDPDLSGHPRVTTRLEQRSARLKQLGNSIVPQVASELFRQIRISEDEKKMVSKHDAKET